MPVTARIRVERIVDVFEALAEIPGALEATLEDLAIFMRSLAIGASPEDKGTFGTSWGQVEEIEGGFSFTNPLPYAHVLEFGLYPGLGPRTVPGPEGGIYSGQAPEGVVRPKVEDPETLQRVARTMADELERRLGRG